MMTNLEFPHRRYNPLTREWVLVSPHRAGRPWLGQVEKAPHQERPTYDPTCYLCPGNERVGGVKNPIYTGTFVFDNDFAALLPPGSAEAGQPGALLQDDGPGLFRAEAVAGICRVVCFSPHHDLTLPELSQEEVEAVLRTWTKQTVELYEVPEIAYAQVFENKGEMMGCSNPHPHSQIWSTSYIPNEPAKELAALIDYRKTHDSCLLCDYINDELRKSERVVAANDHFVAVCPYWAVWPFEVMLVARRHAGSLADLSTAEIGGLADILRQVTIRYDNLFEVSFPYSMGFHQAPNHNTGAESHLHAHFYPPLLRSATVRKFMVGYEILAMPQRDLTPETAAARLRETSLLHYRSG
jgi:UDPglucose--hexose-1-phosphate uridylyltransferase